MLIDFVKEPVKGRLHEKTLRLLDTTREPKNAFVVFQIPKIRTYQSNSEYKDEITFGLCIMNVEDQPGQIYNLNDLVMNRGGKLCCYGNFPTHNHQDSYRVQKYKLYNEPNGANPWDKLAQVCDNLIGQEAEISEEMGIYKQELEKLQKENAALKGGKNVTNTTTATGKN